MADTSTAARRTLLVLMVLAGAVAVVSWLRRQSNTPVPAGAPQWPAFTASWVPPDEDGSTPPGHPIKVKESSGIFHVPGGRFYDRTKPDRCYATASGALADGYRQSKT
jgi:hypothetical protein